MVLKSPEKVDPKYRAQTRTRLNQRIEKLIKEDIKPFFSDSVWNEEETKKRMGDYIWKLITSEETGCSFVCRNDLHENIGKILFLKWWHLSHYNKNNINEESIKKLIGVLDDFSMRHTLLLQGEDIVEKSKKEIKENKWLKNHRLHAEKLWEINKRPTIISKEWKVKNEDLKIIKSDQEKKVIKKLLKRGLIKKTESYIVTKKAFNTLQKLGKEKKEGFEISFLNKKSNLFIIKTSSLSKDSS